MKPDFDLPTVSVLGRWYFMGKIWRKNSHWFIRHSTFCAWRLVTFDLIIKL